MKKNMLYLLFICLCCSCKKMDDWLDVKSKNSDVILSTVADYQSLLDNTTVMNTTPGLSIIASDNIHLLENTALTAGLQAERNAYIWKKDIYEGAIGVGTGDWTGPFRAIAYANIALEGMDKLTTSSVGRDHVRGSALFYRGFHYYQLLQLYAKPYQEGANEPCALPQRFVSDIENEGSFGTVEGCYEQVITDLKASVDLLPLTPVHKTRPSKLGALAMLAKVYLLMEKYDQALTYTEEYLNSQTELLDFATLNTSATLPFPTLDVGNKEIIFYAGPISYTLLSFGNLRINEALFAKYRDNDLRKAAFFRPNADGTKSFKGRYTGTVGLFSGLATNEIMLINAECLVRIGRWQEAGDVLNKLCTKRYKDYAAPTNETSEELLQRILEEKNKELLFTGSCRWEDLRRLNKDTKFAMTLVRKLAGKEYMLPPNDARYSFPVIPQEIITLTK
ncbi:RagB/SusD family nutrient uptake outer membrane protein [Sphingobacterium sp. 2149]|uniref:RagB/SusD family nutrient uptake outer membrane protein n=1 Tax=Sphingobacterium sp. 2149 TaxID=2817763 RepID=UPI0028543D50|nr:RagB/SusD family nutrient uptake outer membrane protein [Sphingobacterium sp. 2149]MDR6733485.1 tetratricopeptide (TPR) repeat protein [Sphingobacterium sp. 2149]